MHTESFVPHAAVPEPQKVVVVNGSPEILELLETVLDAGRYDMVFVEASQHAYSRIKHVQPDLVILCVDLGELDGFHLLSMLKLDAETRHIPDRDLHRRAAARPATKTKTKTRRQTMTSPVSLGSR